MIRDFLREEDGQTTEWALVIALVSVALLSALYIFSPRFRQGIQAWGDMFAFAFGDGNPPQ